MIYQPKYENRKALIIGIDKYEHVSPLKHACNDAQGVVDIIENKFNFAKEDIVLLKDEQATKDNIMQTFHGFTQNKTNPDDKLFVFFAGHGHTISGNRGEVGFLFPVDAKPNETSTLIRWDDLTRNAELIKAKHILFIMDACYGGLAITRAPATGSKRFLKDMCQRFSRQVITAGKADETVADAGGPLPDHSIFTGHLLQGLGGAAANDGVITANGIMSYVYEKVGNDDHSHQTPHYGYIEGDGDFIFTENPLEELETESEEDKDLLIEVSSTQTDITLEDAFPTKIKEYVTDPSKKIILHDIAMQEVRKFLNLTSKEKMPLHVNPLPNEQIIERFKAYENIIKKLMQFFCILAYWGDVNHAALLEKTLKRLTDNNGIESGKTILLNMRWYPICLLEYVAGISAIAAKRYENLSIVMNTPVDCQIDRYSQPNIIVPISDAMAEILDVFKIFPGHEKNYVPRSEYIFKLLQPQLEEILFLGQSYEKLFDRFEMFLMLAYADITNSERGPLGRFGYKSARSTENLYAKLLEEAEAQKDNWPPIKAGLFNHSYNRFNEIAIPLLEKVSKINWW
ncbi:MAG: caspase family protein [Planctomycetes bacterium]|nr:caspase family protein [Planctomycetota bacterium]